MAFLEREFEKRRIVNPRYSLRAYARFLAVDPSTLSQVLRRKRAPGRAFLADSGKRLGLASSEILGFLDESRRKAESAVGIDEVRYRIMASWHHVALFELFALEGFEVTPASAARLLKIPVAEARASLERLEKVDLLHRTPEGKWTRPSSFFSTVGFPLSTPAHRQVQGEFFSMALNAIESVPHANREHSGLTVAARAADVETIRRKIRKFQTTLNAWIERRGAPDSVYQLAMAYFPLVSAESVVSTRRRTK
ncbi:MAG: DUF4423 domain-containing protein [Bdellovibrionales bacterium]|nr:DUF4423 domain-containing protein [Bdellovibrionales bacterium]